LVSLPVLGGPLGYSRRAVPLNLAVSLITVMAALVTRSIPSVSTVQPLLQEVLSRSPVPCLPRTGHIRGHRLSNAHLHRIILLLLVGIGGLLIIEDSPDRFLPQRHRPGVLAGIVFGLLIDHEQPLESPAANCYSTLIFAASDITPQVRQSTDGVSGGERRAGALPCRSFAQRVALVRTVAPMGVGSVRGSCRRAAVGVVPTAPATPLGAF
jgi:hypothetical protein